MNDAPKKAKVASRANTHVSLKGCRCLQVLFLSKPLAEGVCNIYQFSDNRGYFLPFFEVIHKLSTSKIPHQTCMNGGCKKVIHISTPPTTI